MLGSHLPTVRALKRYNRVLSVLAKYNFEDVMAKRGLKKLIPTSYLIDHPNTNSSISLTTYERIRM